LAPRIVEAERLAELGTQQLNTNQFQAALQSFQQALPIYREIKSRLGEAKALVGLGAAYMGLKDISRATPFLQQALAIAQEIKNPQLEAKVQKLLSLAPQAVEAERLAELGTQQLNTNQFQAALQSFQQALPIYRQISRLGEGKALVGLAAAYIGLKDISRATPFLQQALAIAQETKNRQLEEAAQKLLSLAQLQNTPRKAEAYRLLEQGTQQLNTNQFEAALQSWQQALTIYRETSDRQGEMNVLGNLGSTYHSRGDYVKAIDYFQQTLAISQGIKDRIREGASLNNLGLSYLRLGDYAKAINYIQPSLVIAREIKNRPQERNALSNLGLAYINLEDYGKGIDYYQQSLIITRSLKDRQAERNALNDLGVAYRNLGDYTKAIDYLEQSLALMREIKDRKGEGSALSNLGSTYLNLGDYATAIDYYEQSLAIAREIKDRSGEGNALNNQGLAYSNLGDNIKAIFHYQATLEIAREIKDRKGEGAALLNLGGTSLQFGDHAKAINYLQQSLEIAKRINNRGGEANTLLNLGRAYIVLGDFAKAIDYYQQSLVIAREIKDRSGEGNALDNLGVAYRSLGDYAKAIDYHQQSLAILREIADKSGERTVLNNLGYSLLKEGNLREAESILRTAIKTGETLRERLGNNDAFKVSVFEGQARTYSLLQQALIAQNKTNEALEIAERGRARAFVELLANRFTPSTTESTIAAPSLPQIQQIAKDQNATLVEYSIINDEFQVGGKQQTKESELYIWVIKPTGEVTFRRADLKPLWQQQSTTLEGLVSDSRKSIGARGRGLGAVARVDEESQTNRLQQLHQLLIDPIADLLPTDPNARVVFIPQNTLFLVPFPALLDASSKYLVEKHTILTAPAIQVLEFTRQRRQFVPGEAKDVLVVGNPTMPRVSSGIGQPPQQLPSLPAAQQEATEIATLFNTQAITGNGATKAVVVQKMSQARVIHLATHGLLDYLKIFLGLPGAGAVALAPSGQDNGLLTTEEILNLKLNAELVVLSACDTGNGKITGDGIIGLSRSLITAGVPSVIVSLWSVPDAPTAFLMTQFYKNLQQNPDKAQALRSAMLITMKQHPNPKDWAAFTLIGEAE
jgi:CHAT domain-containing protein